MLVTGAVSLVVFESVSLSLGGRSIVDDLESTLDSASRTVTRALRG